MSTVVQSIKARDIIAGAIFIVIALAFGLEATNYPLGRALRMGPGFIPMVLAVLMAGLGIGVALSGLRKDGRTEINGVPWKAITLVLVALAIFGYGGSALGLVPTVFLCGLIISLASTQNTILSSLTIGVALAALSWLIFKVGLSVSLPTFGPVFSF